MVLHCTIIKLKLTRVNIKQFGQLALWGQWLVELTAPHRTSNLHIPLAQGRSANSLHSNKLIAAILHMCI